MHAPEPLVLNPPQGRLLVVGDIHGCRAEFEDLIALFAPTPLDRIILLGDLVNRGPDSSGVVRLARKLGAHALIGNHERRLLNARHSGNRSLLKSFDVATLNALAPEDWTYLERMALTIHLPRWSLLCAHAGFLPGQPWFSQGPEIVTEIQVLAPDGSAARRADHPAGPPWAEHWTGPPYVVYGHTPRPEILRHPAALGLDTGCVYGGHLSAVVFPRRDILQVRARRAYLPPAPNSKRGA